VDPLHFEKFKKKVKDMYKTQNYVFIVSFMCLLFMCTKQKSDFFKTN